MRAVRLKRKADWRAAKILYLGGDSVCRSAFCGDFHE